MNSWTPLSCIDQDYYPTYDITPIGSPGLLPLPVHLHPLTQTFPLILGILHVQLVLSLFLTSLVLPPTRHTTHNTQ